MRNILTDKNRLTAIGNKYRIHILFVAVLLFMSIFAPRFLTSFNITTIFRTVAMNATLAIGFTIVLICAQLDLSIGRIATFSAVVGLMLHQHLGYWGSVPIAILTGSLIGSINGVLVAKGKIHSFIVTIGTMTVLQGLIYTITGGNSVSLSSPETFAVSDFLRKPLLPFLSSRVVITILIIIGFQLMMRRTRTGRNFFITGGNKHTAWLAGINTDRVLILAFTFSGTLAAAGGVLFAMETSAATLNLGENSLMYVISAVIIGGTGLSGGKGSVFNSVIAILTLEILFTGIIRFGLGNEVKIFLSGIILASIVLYEAYANYKHEKIVGQRPELLEELSEAKE